MDGEGHSPQYSPLDNAYDGRDYHVELAQIPKSRAPSYVSSKSSFWGGKDDDQESLIGHARIPSGVNNEKDATISRRRSTGLSTTSTNKDKRKHWLAGHKYGWRFGVSFAAGTATTVLWLNIILTIFAAAKFGTHDGIGTAYAGSCDVVNKWTTWLHIFINILSSLLLSASNYTMQALSAPTRKEVDLAHAKGDWVDIGVPSMRNLFRIKWHRTALWVVLAISSIPIHLLYNSAVFKTIDSNQYVAVVANQRWLDSGNFSTTIPWANAPQTNSSSSNFTWYWGNDVLVGVQDLFAHDRDNGALFRNLTNTECINVYSANFVSGYNHVLLLTNDSGTSANETMFFAMQSYGGAEGPESSWMCANDYNGYRRHSTSGAQCDTGALKNQPDDWTINGKKIDHCLAQIQKQNCTLQFSIQILVAVIMCNALKSASMFVTLYRQRDITLVTVGDAVASFLESPDERTRDRCLMSKSDIKTWKLEGHDNRPNTQPLPKTFFSKQKRWFSAASGGRWTVTFVLIIFTIIISLILLRLGSENLSSQGVNAFSEGFGAIDGRAMISVGLPSEGAAGLISSVLLANLPQAIVSFLYLLYNSLTTCLLLAREWSTYSRRRKPLRVTTPHGAQRSTYYLQLPFRYSAPLLAISATLHWVISQSLFLARINVYSDGVQSETADISQVGYSCPPILTAVLIGVVLLSAAFGMGFQKFRGQMPVVSSCSVAIAAACHPPKDDVDAAYLPVQWGEVHEESGVKSDEMGHCSFTSFEVDELAPGRMYARASMATASYASMSSPSRRSANVR